MKLGPKLYLNFALLVAVGAIIAGSSLLIIRGLHNRFDTAVDKTARKLQLSLELNILKSDLYSTQRGILLTAFDHDDADNRRLRDLFQSMATGLQAKLNEIHPLMSIPRGRQLLTSFETDYQAWQTQLPPIFDHLNRGEIKEAQEYSFQHVAPIHARMSQSGAELAQLYRNKLAEDKQAAADDYAQSLWIATASGLALLALAAFAFYTIRNLVSTLQQTVATLDSSSKQLSSAAGQVAASSQSLASGATEQAASLEEISASNAEVNAMARTNLEASRSTSSLVAKSAQSCVDAERLLDETVHAMNELNDQSGKISQVIKTIDGIAFQTNILALNAAVEAARAGEAGMGFAVVADEVRNLAQRCSAAAKDTASLIEASISRTSAGKEKVDLIAEAIRALTQQSNQVRSLVDQSTCGSDEQSKGIDQISRALTQLEAVNQNAAASAEESAAASQQLRAQSSQLETLAVSLTDLVGTS